jgi:hypothetical protein
MTNPVITNNDSQRLEIMDAKYEQDIVDFGTAETRTVGQILARKILSDTVTITPDLTTGDGTCTNGALGSGGPAKVGDYNLECVEQITNSGRFKLEDPDGKLLSDQLVIPVSSTLYYEGFGLKFDLADGATDFDVGDKFEIATTADGALDAYDPAGLDGTEIPVALMARTRTEAVAGDYPERVLIKGEVREDMVDTATTPTITDALRDLLKDIGIILRPQVEMRILDNQ